MEELNGQKERRNSRRGLIVILIVLVVAIVGLIVGIVVVKLGGSDGGGGGSDVVKCSDLDNVEDIQLCIDGKADDDTSIDDWIGYYQDAIDSAIEEEDYILAAGLINTKVDFLISYGRCGEAMEELDNLDQSLYSQGSLVELYHNGIYYADLCADSEASQKFAGLYNELVNGEQNE